MCSTGQGGSMAEGLELLRRGAAVLANHDPADAPVAAVTEQLRELRGVIDDLEMQACRRLARFDAAGGYEAEEARSAQAWLVHACGMVAGEAARRVITARQLRRLPSVAAAHAGGEVSFGQLATIADAVHHAVQAADPDQWTPGEIAERAEPILLDVARAGVDCTGLAKAGRKLHSVLDPDGAERKLARQFRDRQLSVATTFEGTVDIRGHGDPVTGASAQAAIQAFTKPPTSTDELTVGQRRWDALVRICEMALRQAGKAPDTHGEPAQVRLLIPLSTLQREDGAPAGETDWQQVLPASAARTLSCDSALRRIVTDPLTGKPLDVGKPTRTIPVHVRIAVTARDRTCQWPGGCDMPAAWSDLHHVEHFADGGPATLDNLTLRCRTHHTYEHLREETEHHQQHHHRRRHAA